MGGRVKWLRGGSCELKPIKAMSKRLRQLLMFDHLTEYKRVMWNAHTLNYKDHPGWPIIWQEDDLGNEMTVCKSED